MMVKQSSSEQRIIECLNIYYRIEVTSLTPLLLGADMNASVYKAQGLDQKSYFVKLKGGHNHDIGVAAPPVLLGQCPLAMIKQYLAKKYRRK